MCADVTRTEAEMDIDAFTIRRVATAGHEICDPGGHIIAWAADEAWATLIAFLLNRVEAEGLGSRVRNRRRGRPRASGNRDRSRTSTARSTNERSFIGSAGKNRRRRTMGMGYGGDWADVMEWDEIKKIVPEEAAAFEQQLQAADVEMDRFCEAMWWHHDLALMYVAVGGEDAATQAIERIGAAWKRLAEAFTEATTVEGAGLELNPRYHDPDHGDRYDEVEGGFFHVEGAYRLSPAGRKYAREIRRRRFVEFG